jgi:hypothetical protein
MNTLRLLAAALLSSPALGHEGHGMPGIGHWHATDALGLLLAGGLAALAVWYWRGGGKK